MAAHDIRPSARVAGRGLLVAAVVLTALNLRPALTSVGPILGAMRESLGASATWAGVLTTLPGLCFAAAGLGAPWLARRVGLQHAVSAALVTLVVGLFLRVLDGPFNGQAAVIGGTVVVTGGIALINVLIPVVIKGSFPAQIGVMTGIYTAALQAGGAMGSALTPQMESVLGGWRGALGGWSVLAMLALIAWLVGARRVSAVELPARPTGGSLLRNRLAWTVTLFFGFQSTLAYIILGWLPEVFIDSGVPKATAGMLVGLMSLIAVPVSIFLAPLAARSGSQSGWIVALGVIGLVGVIGLLIDPAAAPLLWSLLVGLGLSVFSLALTVIALRARTTEDTAQLSGMAQGFGYLLAGIGPFLFGLLHDVTEGWTVPWIFVLVIYALQMTMGALAGRDRYV
ncbi:MFS transporter [Mycobacterium intermedium]|uniref:MFS transporter n=1 Tax=Mycobacterium intermedium TaxID=28445 RepID=A0A1E3SC51_MYCIE|nr:MFS transporter [Mycobacterium intermedium]ODQ99728.1 MFS transporter [Mycobacterium intermedium]OPE48603.1 MFS transporter [Mycobacterium intermedium]ORB07234.1 MFS transporter [Mycobacterium intermedium]